MSHRVLALAFLLIGDAAALLVAVCRAHGSMAEEDPGRVTQAAIQHRRWS